MKSNSLDIVAAIFAAAKCGNADRPAYLKEYEEFRRLLKEHEENREPEMITESPLRII